MFVALFGGLVLAALAAVTVFMIVCAWRKMRLYQRFAAIIFAGVVALGANRIIFDEISMMQFHGLAGDGKIENGHYFVGSHGRFFEVRREQYEANLEYGRVSEYVQDIAIVLLIGILLPAGFFRRKGSDWSLATMLRPNDRISNGRNR